MLFRCHRLHSDLKLNTPLLVPHALAWPSVKYTSHHHILHAHSHAIAPHIRRGRWLENQTAPGGTHAVARIAQHTASLHVFSGRAPVIQISIRPCIQPCRGGESSRPSQFHTMHNSQWLLIRHGSHAASHHSSIHRTRPCTFRSARATWAPCPFVCDSAWQCSHLGLTYR